MKNLLHETFEKEISNLIIDGESLLKILIGNDTNLIMFRDGYEIWYTEALYLIGQLIPHRKDDFKSYYDNKSNDSIKKALTYTPPRREDLNLKLDWLGLVPPKQIDYARSLFTNQLVILKSLQKRLTSSLFDLTYLLQAELFDSNLDAAKELTKRKFYRAGGVIAGVVLEKHLKNTLANHLIQINKKKTTIYDLNELLKANNIIDVVKWRFIQHLSDIRNICGHDKEREPTPDETLELINGVAKIIKTLS